SANAPSTVVVLASAWVAAGSVVSTAPASTPDALEYGESTSQDDPARLPTRAASRSTNCRWSGSTHFDVIATVPVTVASADSTASRTEVKVSERAYGSPTSTTDVPERVPFTRSGRS